MNKFFLCLVSVCISLPAFALVDLNTANQAQLEGVNGIGPSKAKAIIEYRSKNGGFRSLEDLDKVPGFGKSTLDKVRSELSVGGARPPAAKPAAPGRGEETKSVRK